MHGGPSVDNLLPAIAQSFAVVLIGYLFGLFRIIHPGDAPVLSKFVGKSALPALLFQNLAYWTCPPYAVVSRQVSLFQRALCSW